MRPTGTCKQSAFGDNAAPHEPAWARNLDAVGIFYMLDIKKLQKRVWDNKMAKGFNTTDVHLEYCFAFEELAEAFHAYEKKLPDVGEELADVVLFVLSLAKMLEVDLEKEVVRKIKKNEKRRYNKVNGANIRAK